MSWKEYKTIMEEMLRTKKSGIGVPLTKEMIKKIKDKLEHKEKFICFYLGCKKGEDYKQVIINKINNDDNSIINNNQIKKSNKKKLLKLNKLLLKKQLKELDELLKLKWK